MNNLHDFVIVFVLAFLHIFFVTQQTRNITQSRYLAYAITAMLTAFSCGYWLKKIFENDFNFLIMFTYALGNAFGGVTGILLHKKFMKKKDIEEW